MSFGDRKKKMPKADFKTENTELALNAFQFSTKDS